MEAILTRCPSCAKLYNIAQKDITSDSPQFKCVQCEKRFWFGFDKKEFNSFGANAVSVTSLLIEPFDEKQTSACPKCGAQNVSNTECGRCGVVFAKLQNALPFVQDESHLGGKSHLYELWQNIMSDFEDLQLHDRFISLCRSEKALPFASLRYGKILSTNPNDDIAKIMRNKIIAMANPHPSNKVQKHTSSARQIVFAGAMVASLTVIVMGLFFKGYNNFAGFGALCFAVILMTRIFSTRQG